MRPVNLIPPEDRRGDRAPLRSGSLSYVLVGGLAVVLVAVTTLVLTQNDIAEKESEIAQLEVDRDAAMTEAETLAPYAEFASLQETRRLTISGLAQSRFDWERVLRELSLLIPSDVTLSEIDASASGAEGDAAAGTGGMIGPNFQASGCAADHDAVARFVAALQDIDGVTRVGLGSTEESKDGGASTGSSDGCGSASTFELTVAFDNAAVSAVAPTPVPPTAPVPADAAGVPKEPAKNSQAEQVGESKQAANLVPGVVK